MMLRTAAQRHRQHGEIEQERRPPDLARQADELEGRRRSTTPG
jgi:hypothetical protein